MSRFDRMETNGFMSRFDRMKNRTAEAQAQDTGTIANATFACAYARALGSTEHSVSRLQAIIRT